MARPIEFQQRGKLRSIRAAEPLDDSRTEKSPSSDAETSTELTLRGQRYRLVPIENPPSTAPPAPAIVDLLTARELQIIALVAEGRVNKQIADDLRISEFTVSTHLRRIFTKLGVDTRAAMVSKCLKALAAREP